jgi:Immunity protein 53
MEESNIQPIEWLMTWYKSRCDGEWEHQHGIHLGTIDNPGWHLNVSLEGTPKADVVIPRMLVERSDDDWIAVEVKDNVFKAHGGPENLSEMIQIFAAFTHNQFIDLSQHKRRGSP